MRDAGRVDAMVRRIRAEHARLEPEMRRLVELCNHMAHAVRGRYADEAPRLLNELLAHDADVPSELDIRAAAIRLFSRASRLPGWLSTATRTPLPPGALQACDATLPRWRTTTPDTAALLDEQRLRLLRDCHRRAVGAVARLCDECSTLERLLRRLGRRQHSFDEILEQAAGITTDDLRAAATRLGVVRPGLPLAVTS